MIVCGGRDCTIVQEVRNFLSAHHEQRPITLLIHGGAPGVDSIAADWADYFGIPVQEYRANWSKNGRAAGPIRNQLMLTDGRPDLVIAIHGARGTADMVRRARRAGVSTLEFDMTMRSPTCE